MNDKQQPSEWYAVHDCVMRNVGPSTEAPSAQSMAHALNCHADMLAALRSIAAQAALTAAMFPNAPGRGDWLSVGRTAAAAIAAAEGRAS